MTVMCRIGARRLRVFLCAMLAAVPGALATISCNQECACAVSPYTFELPQAGAIDVPTNAKIWRPNCAYPRSLVDVNGADVSSTFSCITAGDMELGVLQPYEDLRPNTVYMLDEGEGTSHYHFTTGDGPKLAPPPLPPEVDHLEIDHGRGCGDPTRLATYTLRGAGDVFLLGTPGAAEFDADNFVGFVTAVASEPVIELGDYNCGVDNFPGGASRGASTVVQFAALDITGQFSGWSEPEELSLSGCNVGGAGAAPTWSLLLLLLLLRRRPRLPERGGITVHGACASGLGA